MKTFNKRTKDEVLTALMHLKEQKKAFEKRVSNKMELMAQDKEIELTL
ncbi:MAG: hypothetical protein IJL54_11285 [Prevotella sp.]|nr:hypothetical protein [Prevotella sp.]